MNNDYYATSVSYSNAERKNQPFLELVRKTNIQAGSRNTDIIIYYKLHGKMI